MGIEITYKCDGCGKICYNEYYRLDITHHLLYQDFKQYETLTINGDFPILCGECYRRLDMLLQDLLENLTWTYENEESDIG